MKPNRLPSADSGIFFDFEGRTRMLNASSLYDVFEKDLSDIAIEISKDQSDQELRWSLRPLRAEFKTKDSEKLWQKYTARLQHRFLMTIEVQHFRQFDGQFLVFYS